MNTLKIIRNLILILLIAIVSGLALNTIAFSLPVQPVKENLTENLEVFEMCIRDRGTTYNKIISYENYNIGNPLSLLTDTVLCSSKELQTIQEKMKSTSRAELENIKYQGNYLTGTCDTDESSFLVLSLPYDEGWNVFVNGQNVKTYSVNGGFVGFEVEAGNNQIEMYFTPVGFKQGAIISLIGIMGYVVLIIHEKLKTRNSRRYKNEQSI